MLFSAVMAWCGGQAGWGEPEVIEHGRIGFMVQPEDARDLAAGLVKLLSDPGMMQQFDRQAAKRVRQHLSMGRMVDRYKDLYVQSLMVDTSGMNKLETENSMGGKLYGARYRDAIPMATPELKTWAARQPRQAQESKGGILYRRTSSLSMGDHRN